MNKQIIFPGTVINVNDPMMLGRVRAVPLNEERDKIVKAFCDTCFDDVPVKQHWTNEDPFLYLPLLPFFFSQTPKKDEFVHLIYYNQQSKFKNQFYIQGPFTSPMSIFEETSVGVQNYMLSGKIDDTNVPLKNKEGEYTDPKKTQGIYPEPGDVSILGRGSADLVIKENDVLIRAGKYKETITNPKNLPSINNKRAFIQLSNQKQKKQELTKETLFSLNEVVFTVKYLIEWGIFNPDNNFNAYTGFISIYTVKPDKETNTLNFKINSKIGSYVSAPIFTINFLGKPFDEVVSLINDFIKGFDDGKINIPGYNVFESPNDKYPFAFRPNVLSYQYLENFDSNYALEIETIQRFMEAIKIQGDNKTGCVIVYSQGKTEIIRKPEVTDYTPSIYVAEDMSFNIIGGESIYLLSHNTKIPKLEKINLNDTLYGVPSDKILEIQKNTNSIVRGEQLMDLLNLMVKYMVGHVHPYHGIPPVPVAMDGTNSAEILQKLFDAPNTILNQNIRLN